MGAGFPLNCASFDKLLAAAWVLQCEQDARKSQIPQLDISVAALPRQIAESEVDPATCIKDETTEKDSAGFSETSVPLEFPITAPERFEKISTQPLSCEPQAASNSAFVAALHAMTAARQKRAIGYASRWFSAGIEAIQSRARSFQPKTVRLIVSKRSLHLARISAAPVLLLSVMFAFSVSQMWRQKPAQASQRSELHNSQLAVAESLQAHENRFAASLMPHEGENKNQNATDLPLSHLRITDLSTASTVEGLSPYEIQGLRRQAEYGDQFAALALGMAYETGHSVPQSCTKAAEWIAFAAANGNAAAQYNLGLRYFQGDGLPQDSAVAATWLEKATAAGYAKVLPAEKLPSE
ncbi:MAG: sel1 repeat family protein [Acidobacteriaceae bacterium]|nr:sel1 repeat family protein [Acidobacteriaceae bacterium]